MRPDAWREANDWLRRAERDLLAADRALTGEPPLGDAAVYHAQQAAEKALKALLAGYGHPVPRTHDLVALLSQCSAIQPGLAQLLPAAETLTPYAVLFRYPGGPMEPESEEAREAIDLAVSVVEAARRLMGQ